MSYKHVLDNIIRDCSNDEYLLFVQEDSEHGVFIRTGHKAGGLSNAGVLIHQWIDAFYVKMGKIQILK